MLSVFIVITSWFGELRTDHYNNCLQSAQKGGPGGQLTNSFQEIFAGTNPRDHNDYHHFLTMRSSNCRAEAQSTELDCLDKCILEGVHSNSEHLKKDWRALVAETKPTRTRETNLWRSMTHIASVHLMRALRAEPS